jgi:hypothetical protein
MVNRFISLVGLEPIPAGLASGLKFVWTGTGPTGAVGSVTSRTGLNPYPWVWMTPDQLAGLKPNQLE